MAFALYARKIHCPNCDYDGKAEVLPSSYRELIGFLILFIASFFLWPLIFVIGILFFWIMLKPAKQICPTCKFETPIPIEQWQKTKGKSGETGA